MVESQVPDLSMLLVRRFWEYGGSVKGVSDTAKITSG
jgi:hypothetical protein